MSLLSSIAHVILPHRRKKGPQQPPKKEELQDNSDSTESHFPTDETGNLSDEIRKDDPRSTVLAVEIETVLRENHEQLLREIKPLYALLKEHDLRTARGFEDMMVAKRIISPDRLRRMRDVVEDGLERNRGKKAIAQTLVEAGLCSRSTAYRLIAEMSLTCETSNPTGETET